MILAIMKLPVTVILLYQIAEFAKATSNLTLYNYKHMEIVCQPVNNTSNVEFIQIRRQYKNRTDVVATATWNNARLSDIAKSAREAAVFGSVSEGKLRVTITELISAAGTLYGTYSCLYGYNDDNNQHRQSIPYNITVTAESTGTLNSGGFTLNIRNKASLGTQGFTTQPFSVDFFPKDQEIETGHSNPRLECDKSGKVCTLTGLRVSDSVTLNFTCSCKSVDGPDSYNCTEQNKAAAENSDCTEQNKAAAENSDIKFAVSIVITAVVCLPCGIAIDALLCKYWKTHPLHSSKRSYSQTNKTDENKMSEVKVDPATSENLSTVEEYDEDSIENAYIAKTAVRDRIFVRNKYRSVSKPAGNLEMQDMNY